MGRLGLGVPVPQRLPGATLMPWNVGDEVWARYYDRAINNYVAQLLGHVISAGLDGFTVRRVRANHAGKLIERYPHDVGLWRTKQEADEHIAEHPFTVEPSEVTPDQRSSRQASATFTACAIVQTTATRIPAALALACQAVWSGSSSSFSLALNSIQPSPMTHVSGMPFSPEVVPPLPRFRFTPKRTIQKPSDRSALMAPR